MKKTTTSLVMAMAIAMTALNLQAIPNQVGGVGGFVNIAGMRFENFAGQAATWKPNAKLLGKWEDWKDPSIKDTSIMVYRLNLTADIFGIRASQVTAQVKDEQILSFEAVFDKSASKSASLTEQLATNIQSFTGAKGDADKKKFTHEKIDIQLKDGENGSVVVTFRPKDAAVAVR